MYEPFLSLLDIAVPVIGALNGHAVGGGFGLALVCDLRIGALGGEVRRELRGARARARHGDQLPAAAARRRRRAPRAAVHGPARRRREAERLGILNRAVPAAQVMAEAMEMARAIAANAPFAVRATKAAIRRGLGLESARPRAPKPTSRRRASRRTTPARGCPRCWPSGSRRSRAADRHRPSARLLLCAGAPAQGHGSGDLTHCWSSCASILSYGLPWPAPRSGWRGSLWRSCATSADGRRDQARSAAAAGWPCSSSRSATGSMCTPG